MASGKCTLYKQDTKNSPVDNVCCIFEDNCIFCGEFQYFIPIIPAYSCNCNDKIWGAEGRGPTYGAEGREKQIPEKWATRKS